MSYLMGIDLGSTTLKSVVYNLSGKVVSRGMRPTERFHPDPHHPDWTVWKPEQIWAGTAASVREAAAKLDDPKKIKAVAVTGMGMDGLPMDAMGRWLYPFISWLCPRTEPQYEWWEKTIGVKETFSISGSSLWRHSTALRLLWMAEHEPEILACTHKWLLIEDFLNFMLCGRQATDFTMASCTLLFDQQKRRWSHELLRRAGIDERLLCDPQPSGTVLGEVTRKASEATGLCEGTPVVLGGHDYLCGALPVGAFTPGVMLDVCGTWEVIQTTVPQPVLSAEVQQIGGNIECHVVPDLYSSATAAISAETLEWYRREYGHEAKARAKERGCADWETLMEEAIASPAGSRGVMFLPHMGGSSSPIIDFRSRAGFVGLNSNTTRGDILRALIEGLDFQFHEILQAMECHLHQESQRLIIVGGAVRNEFWMQNKADIVGRPLEVSDIEDASPLGAAMLAGVGIGLYKNVNEAYECVRRPGKVFTPDMKRVEHYAELSAIYRQLYAALRQVNHAISDMQAR
ncbi:MAG: FGGY family carbohydrate kinase [Spirochaetia bacterium]|jgi:xylulokinase